MKKRMLKVMSMLLATAILLSACGTGSSGSGSTPAGSGASSSAVEESGTTKESVSIRLKMTPASAFSGDASDNTSQDPVQWLVTEALYMYFNEGGEIKLKPVLAESHEVAEDQSGVTIKLREDVYFSNGEKMTAEDVEWSFKAHVGSVIEANFPWIDLANVEAKDEYTVWIPFAYFNVAWQKSLSGVAIYCKSYNEANASDPDLYTENVVGTGPYMVDSWKVNDSVTLVKNPSYWGGEEAIIDTVVFRVISEMSVALMELETGGLDVLTDAEYIDAKAYMEDTGDGLEVKEQMAANMAILGFNMKSEKTQDLRLRQAIAYAIDAQAIVDGSLNGQGFVPYSWAAHTCGEMRYYDAQSWPYAYNPEKAKSILEEIGAVGQEFILLVENNPQRTGPAEQIANMLGEVGLNVTLRVVEASVIQTVITNEPDSFDFFIRRNGTFAFDGAGASGNRYLVRMCNVEGTDYQVVMDGIEDILSNSDPKIIAEKWDEWQEKFENEWMIFVPYQNDMSYTVYQEDLQNVSRAVCSYDVNNWYFN